MPAKVRKSPQRGRRPKSAPLETEVEVESDLIHVSEIDLVGEDTAVDDSVFENAPELPKKKAPDPLRPDQDLSEADKAEFKRLLREMVPVRTRAERLAELSKLKGTKTAAIGLRALSIINEITGLTDDTDDDAPSMFELPVDADVEVKVKIPEK